MTPSLQGPMTMSDVEKCPARGELRIINGQLCRFIERELEGDKWEVVCADPSALIERVKVLEEALERVRDMQVNKARDSVWSAAARCRQIALSALSNATGGEGYGSSRTESGGTASPKSDGLCKSEGGDVERDSRALVAEARMRWRAHVDGVPVERLVRAMVGEPGDLTDAGLTRKLANLLDEARDEIYDLRYAITGGEDAPGYLMSLPHAAILEVARENHASTGDWIDRVNRMGAALDKIAGSPLPDQPAASGLSEFEWAVQHIRRLRKWALDGLGCELGHYTPPAESSASSPAEGRAGSLAQDEHPNPTPSVDPGA